MHLLLIGTMIIKSFYNFLKPVIHLFMKQNISFETNKKKFNNKMIKHKYYTKHILQWTES